MKLFRFTSFSICILLLFPLTGLTQQHQSMEEERKPLKVGIALSAGGAKGFAHIGVLKVLDEENIPIHIVTGSSIGAVVGGLYAAGYTPAQMEEIAINTDWQALFNDNMKPSSRDLSTFISTRDMYMLSFPIIDGLPQLPAGLVRGQNLSMLLYRLLLPFHDVRDFSRLPKSFASVATNLRTGDLHRFESGYLPEVIRASAAIPSIFKPVTIDGEPYIDGGVKRSIPAEDALALGSDILIVSDVGEPVKPLSDLNTFVDILFQSVGFHQVKSDSAQIALADFYLRPDIEEYNSFSYEEVKALIARGEEAARAMLPEIKARLDSIRTAGTKERPEVAGMRGEIRITDINYRDIDNRMLNQVKIILDIDPPQTISYSDIERKINRLYATGYFSLISYRIQDDSTSAQGKSLNISFSDNEPDRVGFSMRYDSRYKASLLFGARLRNKLSWSDQFSVDLRLGEILGLSTHYETPVFLKPAVAFQTELNLHRSPIDFYDSGQQLATIQVDRLSFFPSLSMRILDNVTLEAGVRAEYYRLNEAIGGNVLLADRQFLLNGIGSLEFDNINRPYFPTRGFRLHLEAEAADKRFISEATFSQLIGDLQTSIPLYDGLVLRVDALAGWSDTSDLPFHYRYYLGGISSNPLYAHRQEPLWGFATQQLSGSNVAAARAGLQFHLGRDIYLQTGWNAAHVTESQSLNPENFDFNHGYGISLGGLTIIGPINFSISTRDFKNHYAFKIEAGYSF